MPRRSPIRWSPQSGVAPGVAGRIASPGAATKHEQDELRVNASPRPTVATSSRHGCKMGSIAETQLARSGLGSAAWSRRLASWKISGRTRRDSPAVPLGRELRCRAQVNMPLGVVSALPRAPAGDGRRAMRSRRAIRNWNEA